MAEVEALEPEQVAGLGCQAGLSDEGHSINLLNQTSEQSLPDVPVQLSFRYAPSPISPICHSTSSRRRRVVEHLA